MKTLLLAIFSLCPPAFAAEQHIECPARYPAEDIALPQSGQWETGLVPAGIPLDGGGMYAGPIQRRGELRGSERKMVRLLLRACATDAPCSGYRHGM